MKENYEKIVEILNKGGVVVMPTDTIYGIVGKAENREVVEKIYQIRKRAPEKPCIILIEKIEDLNKFSIYLSEEQKKELEKFWSFDEAQDKHRAVSIIFDCVEEKFSYLHRGTKTLAFRIPKVSELRELLSKTGPLVAPSANLEGMPPSKNINEAKNYFGETVDLYIDGGEIAGVPSKIIKIQQDGQITILRN
jgi:L-threonylcarbamoyladenylate synthase